MENTLLGNLAKEAISIKTRIRSTDGRRWNLAFDESSSLQEIINNTQNKVRNAIKRLVNIQSEINKIVFEAAGMTENDISFAFQVIKQARGATQRATHISVFLFPEEMGNDEIEQLVPDHATILSDLVLESLEQGLSKVEVASSDPYSHVDIVKVINQQLSGICQIEDIWEDGDFRGWIKKGAFDVHLSESSESPRWAPILWPLSTPSGSYTLWLYYHRLTDQTLYSCVNDFVEPKLKQVNGDVDTLRRRTNRSRQEEKDLEQLSELVLELAAFRDELLRIARFWQPNLNDGVQITAAPLWRLFQHRAWQKRLKETWTALEAGDYDWAHLAYSMWPERVRAKCKTDKSLAIAHDLEQLYVEPVKPVKAKKGGGKKQVVDEDEQGELL